MHTAMTHRHRNTQPQINWSNRKNNKVNSAHAKTKCTTHTHICHCLPFVNSVRIQIYLTVPHLDTHTHTHVRTHAQPHTHTIGRYWLVNNPYTHLHTHTTTTTSLSPHLPSYSMQSSSRPPRESDLFNIGLLAHMAVPWQALEPSPDKYWMAH